MGAFGTESQVKTGKRTFVKVEGLFPWSEQWGGEEWRRDEWEQGKLRANDKMIKTGYTI